MLFLAFSTNGGFLKSFAGPQVVEKHGWARTHIIPALLRHCFVQRICLGMALQECNSLKSVKM